MKDYTEYQYKNIRFCKGCKKYKYYEGNSCGCQKGKYNNTSTIKNNISIPTYEENTVEKEPVKPKKKITENNIYCSGCGCYHDESRFFITKNGTLSKYCKARRQRESGRVRVRDKQKQREYEKNYREKQKTNNLKEFNSKNTEYMREYRSRKATEKALNKKDANTKDVKKKETPYAGKKRTYIEKYGEDAWRKKEAERKKAYRKRKNNS